MLPIAFFDMISNKIDTNATYFDFMKIQGKNGMIKFFQPWCGHCTAMKPAWDELAATSDSSVFIADVDCSKELELCKVNDVAGYPTIYYYKDGKREKYEGGRSITSLRTFVTENLAAVCNPRGDIEKLCSSKAQKYVLKWKRKDMEDLRKEIKRLERMMDQSMSYDLLSWVKERKSILAQLAAPEPSIHDMLQDFYSKTAHTKAIAMAFYDKLIPTFNNAYTKASSMKVSTMEILNTYTKNALNFLFPDTKVHAYLEKWKKKSIEEKKAEIDRLKNMMKENKNDELNVWTQNRIEILETTLKEEPDL